MAILGGCFDSPVQLTHSRPSWLSSQETSGWRGFVTVGAVRQQAMGEPDEPPGTALPSKVP